MKLVRFEIFKAVIMKKALFWDLAPCRCGVNRRFGGKYRLHLQGRRKNKKIRKRRTSESRCKQTNGISNISLLAPTLTGATSLKTAFFYET
jgi:hypothetical protein